MKISPARRAFRRSSSELSFGNHEPEAIPVHAQPAHRHVLAGGGLWNGVAVGTDLLKLSAGHQVLQAFEQLAAGISVDAEFMRHLLKAGGAFGLELNLLQDGGIGKHGDGCHSRVSLLRIPEPARASRALQETEAGKYFSWKTRRWCSS